MDETNGMYFMFSPSRVSRMPCLLWSRMWKILNVNTIGWRTCSTSTFFSQNHFCFTKNIFTFYSNIFSPLNQGAREPQRPSSFHWSGNGSPSGKGQFLPVLNILDILNVLNIQNIINILNFSNCITIMSKQYQSSRMTIWNL